jgi:flagellar hook-associated protein 1 FlgK
MSGSLSSVLTNATSGLDAVQANLAVLGNNVANASTPGYTAKSIDQSAQYAGDTASGVRTGVVTRSIDTALQASAWSAGSRVSQLTTRSQVLQAVDNTQGTPDGGTSLSDAVAALQASFTTLQSNPSAQTSQQSVVAAAGTLANAINSTASTITTQRNDVQSQIVTAVGSLNSALATVSSTTQQIVTAKAAGSSTADLEDQRDQALQTISGLLNVSYSEQPNGNISILGQNGLSVPLDTKFSTQSANLQPGSTYTVGGTSVPPILLTPSNPSVAPLDVTSQLSGGTLGELVQLRDSTLPSYTAALDSFSSTLASQFNAQGLALFTNGSGAVPSASSAGLSSTIEVNPAVQAAPSLVRDGTSGTPYAPNPSGGPAGYSALIDRITTSVFLATPTAVSLTTQAQGFVTQVANDTAQAGSDLATATSYQTTVSSALTSQSGVNVDNQLGLMIQLQNSYQANARVIQTVQQMFDSLSNATYDANA